MHSSTVMFCVILVCSSVNAQGAGLWSQTNLNIGSNPGEYYYYYYYDYPDNSVGSNSRTSEIDTSVNTKNEVNSNTDTNTYNNYYYNERDGGSIGGGSDRGGSGSISGSSNTNVLLPGLGDLINLPRQVVGGTLNTLLGAGARGNTNSQGGLNLGLGVNTRLGI